MYTETPLKNIIDAENIEFTLKNITKGNKRVIYFIHNIKK